MYINGLFINTCALTNFGVIKPKQTVLTFSIVFEIVNVFV